MNETTDFTDVHRFIKSYKKSCENLVLILWFLVLKIQMLSFSVSSVVEYYICIRKAVNCILERESDIIQQVITISY